MTAAGPGWLARREAEVPAGDDWLTGPERRTLGALHVPKRRADWRLGRWTAKEAVRATLGRQAPGHDAIEIRPASDGAPEAWIDGEPAPLCLSITHRSARAVAAVVAPGVSVGCDLELVEARRGVFLEDFFTTDEVAAVRRAARESPDRVEAELVTRLWAAKEAALKTLREGLRIDTKRLEVEPPVSATRGAGVAVAPVAARSPAWEPIAILVRVDTDRRLHGWWRAIWDMVLVVVTDPPASEPRAL